MAESESQKATAGEPGETVRSLPPARVATPLAANTLELTPFVLEESDAVVTVDPKTEVIEGLGLLIADRAEHQVRMFDMSGDVVWRFGVKGRGPTDLLDPMKAVYLPDSTVFVVSFYAHDSRWAGAERRVLYTRPRRPLRLPVDATVLADTLIAIGNRARFDFDTTLAEPIVELVRASDGVVVDTIFRPDVGALTGYAVGMDGFASVASRGDTLAATFSVGGSIHLFSPDGREIEAIEIPWVRYRASDIPGEDYLTRLRDLSLDVTVVDAIYWLNDGSFMLQIRDRRQGPGDINWHAMRVGRHGEFVFESPVARLRAVDEAGLRIFVQDPTRLEPNRWLVGTLKPWKSVN